MQKLVRILSEIGFDQLPHDKVVDIEIVLPLAGRGDAPTRDQAMRVPSVDHIALPSNSPDFRHQAAFFSAMRTRLRRIVVAALMRSSGVSMSRMNTIFMSGRTLAKEACSVT